jgi:hypothetical protein
LSLTATGCGGGLVLLDWSAYQGTGFARYVVLRGGASVPAAYPPQGGSSEVKESATSDRAHSSAIDRWAPVGSTWSYRALALDALDRVIGATDVRSVAVKPTRNLGSLVADAVEGGTRFRWTAFGGPSWCFSHYKLVASTTDSTPSYLEGAAAVWVGESPGTAEAWVAEVEPGTYWFRLQAIRTTEFGKVVVAETEPLAYTVP